MPPSSRDSVGGDTGGEDQCIDGDLDVVTEGHVECLHDFAVVLGHGCSGVGPDELDSELAGLEVHLLTESIGPDVLVDDGDVRHGVGQLGLDGDAEGG